MPVKLMTQTMRKRMATRAFLYGPPNTLKTSSILLTAHYPLTILSLPGESGWGTIPADVPGLASYVWEGTPGDLVTASSIRRDVEKLAKEIVSGKLGACRTLAVEGLHKWHGIYMDVATEGAFGRGEDFEPAKYGNAHRMFANFVQMLIDSPVEYLIVTSWNAREADRPLQPGEKARDVSTHEWPDLPGNSMPKRMAGMFSLLVFSRVKNVPGKPGMLEGEWLLRPDSEVWGANAKVDPRVVAKLPAKVPQDWKNLYKVVGQAEEEVAKEDHDQSRVA